MNSAALTAMVTKADMCRTYADQLLSNAARSLESASALRTMDAVPVTRTALRITTSMKHTSTAGGDAKCERSGGTDVAECQARIIEDNESRLRRDRRRSIVVYGGHHTGAVVAYQLHHFLSEHDSVADLELTLLARLSQGEVHECFVVACASFDISA